MSNKEDINKKGKPYVGFHNLYKNINISVKTLDKIIVILIIALIVAIAYAISNQGFLIEFDSQGGTNINSQKHMHGEKVIYEIPEREGYIFEAWALDKDCNNIYDFNNEVNNSFKLYACWIKK